MIVFNIHAIIQLVIIFLALLVCHVVCLPFGVDLIEAVGRSNNETNALIFVAIIAMYTDIKGIKGRLFWIPIWIIALALILFVNNSRFMMGHSTNANLVVLLLVLLYFAFSWLHYAKRLRNAKMVLELLANQNPALSPVEYWNLVETAYYQPPFLFLKAYSLWQLIREPVFSGQDFVEHYGKLLDLQAFRDITLEPYDEWIRELKTKLNNTTDFSRYQDPERDLKRIAQIIDRIKTRLPENQNA